MEYTISELIDKLIILNIKIYNCVDIVGNINNNDAIVSENARKAQLLNKQRSQIKNEIDALLGKKIEELEIKL